MVREADTQVHPANFVGRPTVNHQFSRQKFVGPQLFFVH